MWKIKKKHSLVAKGLIAREERRLAAGETAGTFRWSAGGQTGAGLYQTDRGDSMG